MTICISIACIWSPQKNGVSKGTNKRVVTPCPLMFGVPDAIKY